MSNLRYTQGTKPVLEFTFADPDTGDTIVLATLVKASSFIYVKTPAGVTTAIACSDVGITVDTDDDFIAISFKAIAAYTDLNEVGSWLFNFLLDFPSGSTGTNELTQFEIEVLPTASA